jgi:hypothetical protein
MTDDSAHARMRRVIDTQPQPRSIDPTSSRGRMDAAKYTFQVWLRSKSVGV